MPINAHPEYVTAEKRYHEAQTDSERILALEEMIKWSPKHKGAETLRVQLKSRYKKLKQELEKKAKKKGGSKTGIKKGDMQAVLLGKTNSGKSSILKTLTKAEPKISNVGFTTKNPVIGVLHYKGTNIQIIDSPPIACEYYDQGLINGTDTILIVVEKIDEIPEVMKPADWNKKAKKIIILNKTDKYDENTKRKIRETLKSKRYNFVLTSTLTKEGIEELKEKLFHSFDKIRVFTRQPGSTHDDIPVVIEPNSTLADVAEKVLHGYSKKVKFAKITGPSCKFSNQKVGLKHKVKNLDIVEFYTE